VEEYAVDTEVPSGIVNMGASPGGIAIGAPADVIGNRGPTICVGPTGGTLRVTDNGTRLPRLSISVISTSDSLFPANNVNRPLRNIKILYNN